MAVNQNGFNSRITSEALEERFRQVFPAQAGAELIQDLYASGVIVPTIDFTSIAEGSFLPESLQQAWDFATGYEEINNVTQTLANTPGFWLVDFVVTNGDISQAVVFNRAKIFIDDGATSKTIWSLDSFIKAGTLAEAIVTENRFIVFLRAGDSLKATSSNVETTMSAWFRQIASVNGTLVNPLGFTF